MGRAWKRSPKATQTPTLRDIAWAAGFLEGEGSFVAHKTGANVAATQKQKEPLERLQAFFGGTVRERKWRNKHWINGDRETSGWYWVCCGARGRGIMMTIFSFMSPRRKEQIRKALSA